MVEGYRKGHLYCCHRYAGYLLLCIALPVFIVGSANALHSLQTLSDHPLSLSLLPDSEALIGFRQITQLEGIIPALESAHAVYAAMQYAAKMRKDQDIVICVSGRGDKDVQSVAEVLPKLGPKVFFFFLRGFFVRYQ